MVGDLLRPPGNGFDHSPEEIHRRMSQRGRDIVQQRVPGRGQPPLDYPSCGIASEISQAGQPAVYKFESVRKAYVLAENLLSQAIISLFGVGICGIIAGL